MVTGVIKTKDVLLNPASVIAICGFRGFLRLLKKILSRQNVQFLDFVEITKKTALYKKPPSPN
ncbi:MAG: hypothetical protein HYS22_03025 [Deltaproteobacteria bacterium]|nr:hypothetical protein [Deltaproteobacteria bacterium]